MTTYTEADRATHEAIGWLVNSAGREFMLRQVQRAEGEYPHIAAQLEEWAARLAPVDNRKGVVTSAAFALSEAAGAGVWEEGEAEKWAEVVLRSAGVIR